VVHFPKPCESLSKKIWKLDRTYVPKLGVLWSKIEDVWSRFSFASCDYVYFWHKY